MKLDDIESYHLSILITYQNHISRVNSKPSFKWKLKDTNWTSFIDEVDRRIPSNYGVKKNVNKLEKKLRKAILKAASKHIGKRKVNKEG